MKLTVFDAQGRMKTTTASNPTITDFTNATHTHANAANGGQLNAGSVFSAGAVPLARGGTNADLSATGPGVLQQRTAGASVTLLKHNFGAATAPTTGDDTGDGYDVGSFWYDTTADKIYNAIDVTLGAAVWKDLTPTISSSPWQTTTGVVNLVTSGDTVTIGSTTAGGKFFVDGDADEIQMQVQAHSTQTNLIAVWQNSSANNLVTISGLGAVVINEQGNDADTRIEGDTDQNLWFVDASTDRVGIGTSSPGEKLEVTGNILAKQTSGNTALITSSAAGDDRAVEFQTGGSKRWAWRVQGSEGGGTNFGSDMYLTRYNDSAGSLGNLLQMSRADGYVQILGNVAIGASSWGTSATNTLAILDGTAPSSSPSNAVQVFCDLVTSTYELRVRDSAGNVTTQSPHNPQLINTEGRITTWAHKEENPFKGYRMEADIFRTIQLVEGLTGETLIHTENLPPGQREDPFKNRLKNKRQQWRERIYNAS